MKRFLKNSPFGLVLLAGTMAFTACSSDEDPIDAPTGGSVKTQLAISVGSGSQSQLRMTSDVVQNPGENFRGMENIVLASFTGVSTSAGTQLSVGTPASLIALSDITSSDISSAASSKVYSNISIPLNTNVFLFYGKAQKSGTIPSDFPDSIAYKLYYGDITWNMNATPAPTAFGADFFKHNPIITDATTKFTGTDEAGALIAAMNAIANVKDAVQEAIKTLAINFTASPAGSSAAILARVNNLLKALGSVADTDPVVDARDAIYALFTKDPTTDPAADAVQKVFGNHTTNPASVTFTTTLTNIDKFPGCYGLPDGAARLKWTPATPTTDGTFSYVTDGSVGTGAIATGIANYVYPAELTYYVASPVLASNDAIGDNWAKNTSDWMTNPYRENSTTGGSGSASVSWNSSVSASSKTVAIANNINYGVAQLQTTVKTAAATLTYIDPDDNSPQSTTGTLSLPFTGMIIGGQPASVGYNFLPVSTTTFDNSVYDKVSSMNANTTSGATYNYTLLFDNYKSGDTETVNVALEFENTTGKKMKGIDGTVYPGQKFYVLGKLDPSATGVGSITWPTSSMHDASIYFPANGIDRVFVQDFTTTANFTLGSLKNIYVTIPDLRATQLTLGLSVDLVWKAGLSFDVDIE